MKLHGVTTQKTTIDIFTTVRILNHLIKSGYSFLYFVKYHFENCLKKAGAKMYAFAIFLFLWEGLDSVWTLCKVGIVLNRQEMK
jgi:hypothetical protein